MLIANVDVTRDVHSESAHFIALKVSAVHLRRGETLGSIESFVLTESVKLLDLKSLAQVCKAFILDRIMTSF